MSAITSLINQLRTYAKIADQLEKLRGKERTGVVKALYEAADTIEELSAKLHALQMERSSQHYHGGWIPCSERLPELHQETYIDSSGEEHRFRRSDDVLGCYRYEDDLEGDDYDMAVVDYSDFLMERLNGSRCRRHVVVRVLMSLHGCRFRNRIERREMRPIEPKTVGESSQSTKLVKAADVIKALDEIGSHYEDGHDHLMRLAKAKVTALPPAEPEIIRCKDCKHNPKETWFECPMSHLSEKQRPETAWCWKGERRTDE